PEVLKAIGDAHVSFPEDFTPHPKLKRLLERRAAMASEGDIDWAMGELLAFGSLLLDGIPVRLAGQDSRRGTFASRFATVIDRTNANEWTPLSNLTEDQARFHVYDSLLSEYAALGFEYGYSVARPEALVLWEAQFGDFANGAQVIIDQFISSAEDKWGQRNSLVMLLPHGYEGQGPEHSSARMERFLQLSARGNMQVCYPSTPAQYCHMLRRQARLEPRKPLVCMTPKSLLRLPAAVSKAQDFTDGVFQEVIDDVTQPDPARVRRVVLCTGKVYYDLEAYRTENSLSDVAVVRVEQLYPYPGELLGALFRKYGKAREVVWTQEEPRNMGAWDFIDERLTKKLAKGQTLTYVC
ncbi:MAG TPA: multifunctional oxoglutarate decarboxylase/oxoglutarate dehydrogenase thiamine pyrophosphate-binding subunit/dihydrolipoyllysine-residue succinyltransferase subunit, partial [Myxococcota bacterium]|nr:multifunctional oxoglutarate decarboxylase/oxoglutarate dehydrogenase thiamine pyrophosphate-binding subunit/dihydrolipoyllysine-residue succinyltransferase subunit [Myxococcota bacterium]